MTDPLAGPEGEVTGPSTTVIEREPRTGNEVPVSTESGPTGTALRRLGLTALGLALAWLIPVAAHAVGVDWLVLLLVIFGTASVMQRSGGLVDRLVLAMTALAGVTCGAAVLFSIWPWHLHPVPLAGLALTLLVLICGVFGRLPSLPRPRLADLLVAGPVLAFAFVLYYPLLRRPLSDRLGLMIVGEDRQRHFMVWDTTREIGAYLFFRRYNDETAVSVLPTDRTYPTGAHMIGAVLDNFVTSSTVPGEASAAFARFLWYDLGAYTFLFLTVIWGARRLGGAAANLATFVPVATLAGCYMMFGDIFPSLMFGFLAQTTGMAFLAVIVVLSARPLPSGRQQIVVISAGVVGLAFTYYLLLPFAAVAILYSLVIARRRILRQWPWLLAAAVVTLPAAAIPRMTAPAEHSLDLLLQAFGIAQVRVGAVVVLVATFGLVMTARRRLAPSVRAVAISLGAVILATITVGAVQIYHGGALVYFFDKMMYCVIVLGLIALGTAAPLLRRMFDSFRGRGVLVTALVLFFVLVATATGGLDPRTAVTPARDPVAGIVDGAPAYPTPRTSWGLAYLTGDLDGRRPGRMAYRIYNHTPNDGRVVIPSVGTGVDHSVMLHVAVLHRHAGKNWNSGYIWTFGEPTPDRFAKLVTENNDPTVRYRVVTDKPELLERLRRLAADRPDLGLDVVDVRTLPL